MKRHLKRTIFLAILALLLPGSAAAQVVINEIMYHPLSDQDGDEFVEIFNAGGGVVDLSDWCFDGIQFCFNPGASIAVGQYLVLASDAARFQTTYGAPPDHVYLLSLSDNGERLALLDNLSAVQDEVSYDDGGAWPVTPDGLGPSLELLDPDQDNAIPRNWHGSSANGGTPGALNSVDQAGLPPWIQAVQHTADIQPNDPLVVAATVLDATSVQLSYVIDFGTESSFAMLDDGASNDGGAGDGVYGASIPGQPAGTLLRYRIAATGSTGSMDYPRDDDTIVYDGTAVIDPALTSSLPILHRFMDPLDYQAALDHKLTDETEPCVLFYAGQLYDAVQTRVRGQSARLWPKPPWKFFLPQGHNFSAPQIFDNAVDTFDLQSNYSDKSYLREILAWETMRDSGVVYNQVHPVRVEQNGVFFGLFNFLEAPERDWVVRNKLSLTGARYKAFDDCRTHFTPEDLESYYEKKSRLDEDYSDLYVFLNDLNSLNSQPLMDFLRDNVNIPDVINYLATLVILHNNDHVKKNYFLYRDSDGTERWTMHPWDLDLTFGRNWVYESLNDEIWADVDYLAGQSAISPSHPLFGDSEHQKLNGVWNRFVDRVLDDPELQEMFYRRLRTLMDELLVVGRYEARIDELATMTAPEAESDRQSWGWYGASQDQAAAVSMLKQDYLNPRRVHLYTTHGVCNIPDAQELLPRIVISEIMYNPPGGPDHEFVELFNPSATEAVDISDWRLDGVALNIPAGTVIPAQGHALFVKNDVQFRLQYGGGKFVAAQYGGALDDLGESLVLRNPNGGVISSVAYEAVAPWPAAAAGSGSSLELIDTTVDERKVINWAASPAAGGTPGAANGAPGPGLVVPELYINEVLPDNGSVNQDGMGDFDPWIEIYNGSSATIDLGGMYLSTDLGVPDMWPITGGTNLCSKCWMLFWADGETGEGTDHTNFTLSGTGGSVGLFASDGTLVDYVNYGTLATDYSYGRFTDGLSDLRIFSVVTPAAANDVPPVSMILNEYNAVADGNFLANLNADTYWGRIEDNGGDWFELVVTQDHLDARGWELHLSHDTGGAGEASYVLTLTNDTLWSDLRAGTIITVAEGLADDVSFDPENDDWWVNVQTGSGGSGLYVSATEIEVSNVNWQLTIKDDQSQTVFGPAGEGVWPVSGIGSDEVFKLEEDPGPYVTPVSDYNDGTSSTFGAPNVWAAGTRVQDFTSLWSEGIIGQCSGPDTDSDGYCDSQDNCPGDANPSQTDTDGDGLGDACDTCPIDPYNDAEGDGHCADVDNCPSVANAGQVDADTDGVGDLCDNCASDANANQADDDSDGLGDACDACVGDPVNDPDTDGICDSVDNCPGEANAGQEDVDSDGVGDPCDTCPSDPDDDIDLDGLCADADNCPRIPNAVQDDADTDGLGDVCDNCVSTANASQQDTDSDFVGDDCDDDDDGDGVDDGTDNCPLIPNSDQRDTDTNGQGDLCDGDDDGDGLDDGSDNCPLVPNGTQSDVDSDGAGDECDCDDTLLGVAVVPGQLGGSLHMDKTDGGTLTWLRGPQGHVSHVYRGTFITGQAWSYDEVCLDPGNADTTAVDASDPPADSGYYYLVSGANTCGEGPAGEDSAGTDIVPAGACSSGAADIDSDGLDDLADNCPTESNLTQTDDDQDFVGTQCDNCPSTTNFDQADQDGDGEGDLCDGDIDGDGTGNGTDNCPLIANVDQSDADYDGVGDLCDSCTDVDSDGLGAGGLGENRCAPDRFPDDPENDADGDNIGGTLDNCPNDYNPDQADCDLDGQGDPCDTCSADPANDIDSDGLCAGSCTVVDVVVIDFESPEETVLIQAGSSMKYLVNTTDPGLAMSWAEVGFDDSGWSDDGIYGVGYEADSGAEALLQTTVAVGAASVYTRTTFEITNVDDVDDLWISADFDDGYVVWINGIEVYRSPQMPAGLPAWDSSANAHESSNGSSPDYGDPIDISAAALTLLHTGTNNIAIGVWNHTPAVPPSNDLVLVPRLAVNRQPTMTYLDNQAAPVVSDMSWADELYDDSGWSAGVYGVGYEKFPVDGATLLLGTTVPEGTTSIYTRARFIIQEVSVIEEVLVGADYDDGYVAWINGVEVFRSMEMPGGPLAWDSVPSLHESSNAAVPNFGILHDVSVMAVPELHTGINVLAVGVWNNRPDSSDLVLVPTLATNGLGTDNCPTVPNPGQADGDNDGIGDVCDNCPAVFNPVQVDSDLDGSGDACDPA